MRFLPDGTMRRVCVGSGGRAFMALQLWEGVIRSCLGPLKLQGGKRVSRLFGSLPKDICYLGNGPDNMSAFAESQSQKEVTRFIGNRQRSK